MGRKTKAQRERAKKRTVTTPDGSEVQTPRKPRSQFPVNAKKPMQPRPNPITEALKSQGGVDKVQDILKGFSKLGNTVNPEARAQASTRMKAVLDMLNSKPGPILEQLRGLGIEVTVVHNVRGNPEFDTVVIKVADLERADREIASRGTLYDQVWKGSQE